jgi:hypothetical protein
MRAWRLLLVVLTLGVAAVACGGDAAGLTP